MKLPRTPDPKVNGSIPLLLSSEKLVLFVDVIIHDEGFFQDRSSIGIARCGAGLLLLRDACVILAMNLLTLLGSSLTRSMRIDGNDTQRKPAANSSSVQIVTGT
jgi:hypothetical protein